MLLFWHGGAQGNNANDASDSGASGGKVMSCQYGSPNDPEWRVLIRRKQQILLLLCRLLEAHGALYQQRMSDFALLLVQKYIEQGPKVSGLWACERDNSEDVEESLEQGGIKISSTGWHWWQQVLNTDVQ